jgi:hypothetical protein
MSALEDEDPDYEEPDEDADAFVDDPTIDGSTLGVAVMHGDRPCCNPRSTHRKTCGGVERKGP